MTAKKVKILAELASGSSVSNLAKSYGCAKNTIYEWIKKQKQLSEPHSFSDSKSCTIHPAFVQIEVPEQTEPEIAKISPKSCNLSFENFSLIIEGSINSTKLIKILQILEATC
jgi:transposase-like protein